MSESHWTIWVVSRTRKASQLNIFRGKGTLFMQHLLAREKSLSFKVKLNLFEYHILATGEIQSALHNENRKQWPAGYIHFHQQNKEESLLRITGCITYMPWEGFSVNMFWEVIQL